MRDPLAVLALEIVDPTSEVVDILFEEDAKLIEHLIHQLLGQGRPSLGGESGHPDAVGAGHVQVGFDVVELELEATQVGEQVVVVGVDPIGQLLADCLDLIRQLGGLGVDALTDPLIDKALKAREDPRKHHGHFVPCKRAVATEGPVGVSLRPSPRRQA